MVTIPLLSFPQAGDPVAQEEEGPTDAWYCDSYQNIQARLDAVLNATWCVAVASQEY